MFRQLKQGRIRFGRLGVLFLGMLLVVACASSPKEDSQKDSESAQADTNTTGSDSGSDSATSFDDTVPVAFATYGTLTTIAGTCSVDDKGVNSWDASFEGAPAVEAELSRPHFAMADEQGNIYIADKDAHGVRIISPAGIISTVAGTTVSGDDGDGPGLGTEMALFSPNGLWVRRDGTVYILDLGNSKVRKLTPEGEMTTLFTDDSGIRLGRGIWMNDTETLCYYASGNSVRRWTPDTGVTTYADGFSGLGMVVVDGDGNVVVTDRVGNRVVRIEDDGTQTTIAGTGSSSPTGGAGQLAVDTSLSGVRGIWFLDDGSYFLATHEGSQVWFVDPMGTIFLFLDGNANDAHAGDGEPFHTPGAKVSEIRGISVDAAGNVIITENDCGYIRKVSKIIK